MPFVHHHRLSTGQTLNSAFLGDEDVQRFRSRNQNVGKRTSLLGFFLGGSIARPRTHLPIQSEPFNHSSCSIRNVRGQCAQRSHPNQLHSKSLTARSSCSGQHVPHRSIGFPTSRRRLKQPILPLSECIPHLHLESLRHPTLTVKPRSHRCVLWVGFNRLHDAQKRTSRSAASSNDIRQLQDSLSRPPVYWARFVLPESQNLKP